MTWEDRIKAARVSGEFTNEDTRLLGSWRTCLVGEAVAEFGQVTSPGVKEKFRPFVDGLAGVIQLFCSRSFDALEAQRIRIWEHAESLYGPSPEALIALCVEEAKRVALEPLLEEVSA